jgi:MoaA/NifB/PqqE/SkfB family radical SAM enzyme
METNPAFSDFGALRFVTLRLLWDCNLRCVMCDHPYKPRLEMTVATAHRVLDQLTHPVRLAFIGGEPCLWLLRHPEILRRALDDGHVVHLTTNGILLPRLHDFVAAFADRPVSIQFSIDGFGANYERVRPRARWNDVVASIRLVHQRRKAHNNSRAVIIAGYLLMRSTLADLPRFVEFCAEEGVDAVTLTYALIYDSMVQRGTIAEADSVYHNAEAARAAIATAIETARRCGIALGSPPALGSATEIGRQWQGRDPARVAPGRSPSPAGVACSRPWKEVFVNQDGTIVPCCCGSSIGPAVGKLDEGLETVWNSSRIQEVRIALAGQQFDAACRCGVNMNVGTKGNSLHQFFTKERNSLAEVPAPP